MIKHIVVEHFVIFILTGMNIILLFLLILSVTNGPRLREESRLLSKSTLFLYFAPSSPQYAGAVSSSLLMLHQYICQSHTLLSPHLQTEPQDI